jgi:hypothetical protein
VTSAAELPFDCVELADLMANERMGVAKFLALPLSRRIKCVLDGRVQFFSGSTVVDRQIALRALMQLTKR